MYVMITGGSATVKGGNLKKSKGSVSTSGVLRAIKSAKGGIRRREYQEVWKEHALRFLRFVEHAGL